MFDDPKKNLKHLEEQLREIETPGSETGDDLPDDESWLDDELREAHALMNNDYSSAPSRQTPMFDFDEESEDEVQTPAVYTDAPPAPRAKKSKKVKKEKGIGGLVFLACLETLGIIAVLLWWVLWLL